MSYDPNVDYAAQMARYLSYGDYKNAALAEQARNEKILGEGMTQYAQTFDYAAYLPGGEKYTPDADELLREYLSRPDFSFDPASSELYAPYRAMYTRDGQLAMEDSMGQAAGLTGGYGSSYAAEVGQQTYNDYMSRLNDLLPELYARQRSAYEAAGEDLFGRYSAAQTHEQALSDAAQQQWSMEQAEQGEAWDAAFQLWGELGYAPAEVAAVLGIAEGTPTSDALYQQWSMEHQEQQGQEQQEDNGRSYAYSLCMAMFKVKQMPSDALLAMAGISKQDAQKLLDGYMAQE